VPLGIATYQSVSIFGDFSGVASVTGIPL